jgi:dienelactone hydrolase
MSNPLISARAAFGLLFLAIISITGPDQARAGPIPVGTSEQTAALDTLSLDVFTYRPSNCAPSAFLIVFHGIDRDADNYRDVARPLADRLCVIVAAPLFDKARFPTWRYQHGGLVDKGTIQNSGDWTGRIVLKLVDWLRQQEGRADMPYSFIGHSAGAQFLSRFAAYIPSEAQRIVIANPSTHVLASLEEAPPYGFRGLPDAEESLRRYLAQPVTIFLGEEDRRSKNLADDAEAEAQGGTRIERGRRAFRQAEQVAHDRGWVFNWRLVEVPGVGHSAKSMFASPMAVEALARP